MNVGGKSEVVMDEKDEPKDNPKGPYETSGSVGGFLGAVVGYVIKSTVVTSLSWWHSALFVGGAAIIGGVVAEGFCYIWVRFLKK